MNILSSFAPPSTFQIGIRALSRQSARWNCASVVRQLSAASRASASSKCRAYSNRHSSDVLGTRRQSIRPRSKIFSQAPARTYASWSRFRAITHYTQLPDSYEDAEGLPFRKEDLNLREAQEIFGRHILPRDANRLLRILHGRRVAGTLDDPDLTQNTAHYRREDKTKAMEYLRKNIPVDEVINAGLRAEDELKSLEAQQQQREEEQGDEDAEQTQETSPQSPPSNPQQADDKKVPTGQIPKTTTTTSPYGEGVFDRMRARNEAIYEAKKQQEEEERKKQEEQEALGNIGPLSTQRALPRKMSPWMKKYAEGATTSLKEAPEMKTWERLLPMYTFALLLVGACAGFAMMYKPPNQGWRLWPEMSLATATILGLIGLNGIIWSLWKIPPLWALFNRYLVLIPGTPKPFQLVGAIFSHQGLEHLFLNMIFLWFFGTRLHEEIGRGNFLALYLSAGTIGFLTSMTKLTLLKDFRHTSIGASGAVYGIMAAFFWLHRYDEFKILGYPPDPVSGPQGLAFLGLLIGMHIAQHFSKRKLTLDLWSHVGGMLAGMIGIEIIESQRKAKLKAKAEKPEEDVGLLDKVMVRKDQAAPSKAV